MGVSEGKADLQCKVCREGRPETAILRFFLESLAETACAAGLPGGVEEPASEDTEDTLPMADL